MMKTRLAGIALTIAAVAGTLTLLAPSSRPQTSARSRGVSADAPPRPNGAAARPAAPVVELDKAKQQAIWDAEHITFELEQVFGKVFLDAFCARDPGRLAALLKPGFQARIFTSLDGAAREQSGIREVQVDGSADRRAADAPEFVAHLAGLLSDVETIESRGFRVLSITPAGSPGDADVWNTRILVSIAGPRAGGGLVEVDSTHRVSFSFADKRELEGEPVVTDWEDESHKRRSTDRPFMVEVTGDVGLDAVDLPDNWTLPPKQAVQYRFQVAVEDFDRDGWLDVAVAEFGKVQLLRWSPEGGRFEEVSRQFGVGVEQILHSRPNALAAWIDYNNDGYPDLLLGNRLYRNEQGRRFTDVTDRSGLSFGPQAMGVNVVDYDCDGRLDLYILYQASPQRQRPGTPRPWINDDDYGEVNRLWRNEGDGRFRDVTLESQAGGGRRHTLAATWFFYDDDHYPDVYVANDLSTNSLLRNNGDGTFRDVSGESRTTDFATSMGVVAGDTDNDGTADLYIANMFSKMGRRIIEHVCEADYPPGVFEQIQGSCAGNRLYRRAAGRAEFDEFGEAFGVEGVGWAYAPAMADLDNDGWLDLYATTGFLSFERGEPDG
ncbi:MAG TPA: VCBS repeat-containing protein [Planctomycetaceae bacterium]|nr:VCBS repeat-containing protein [Planctomycetaceae bacterium]